MNGLGWVQGVAYAAMPLLAVGFLVRSAARVHRGRRREISGLAAAMLLPWFVVTLQSAGILSPAPALTAAAIAIVALVVFGLLHGRQRYFDRYGLRARLIETLEEPIFLEDGSGRLMDMNAAAEHLLGTSASSLRGGALMPVLRRRAGAAPDADGYLRVADQGRERIFRFGVTAITVRESATPGRVVVLHDETEVLAAQQATRRARRDLEQLQENLPVGVYRSSADEHGHVLVANRALLELLGYPSTEALNEVAAEELYADPEERHIVLEATERKARISRSVRLRRRDGSVFWAQLHISRTLGDDGRMQYLDGIVEDITEAYKAHQKAAQEHERAVRASQAKTEFLANMSHEIRTPLNGVVGMVELLGETELDGEQRRFVDTIAGCSDLLLGVIESILDFSKIESGKLELESVPLDLHRVVGEVADMFAAPAQDQGLELVLDVGGDVPRLVSGDSVRLRQVISNLLGNAIKFTERGEIELKVEASGDHVAFAVRDTGIGFDEATRERIFESFEQADTSTTRRYGGTGLGLAICRRLVGLMGGELTATSSPGRGSCFRFDLPLPVLDDDRAPIPRLRSGLRVLAVDDNRTNRELVTAQLCRAGASVVPAASAEEACGRLAEESFDVALVDIQMPEIDGVTFARGQHDRGLITPMIALSSIGNEVDDDEEELFAARLTKPVKARDLIEAVALATGTGETCGGPSALASGSGSQTALPATRVLVVEDNKVNQTVAAKLLGRMGCEVEVAGDGAEALSRLSSSGFDLVLMDVHMPVMDGLEAVRRIRAGQTGCPQVPVIALTAGAGKRDRLECLEAGMNTFLTKPVRRLELEEAVRRYCDDGAAEAGAFPQSGAA